MSWKLSTTKLALRGLDAIYAGELYLCGYDEEGLWLVRPEHDFAREKIVGGTDDDTRDGSSFFGATAMAADARGNLYVAYDKGDYPKGEIGLATRTKGKWKTTVLAKQEAAIGSTSERHIAIAVTDDGRVTVAAGVLGDSRELAVLRPGEKPKRLGVDVDGVAITVDATGATHVLCNPSDQLLSYAREVNGTWKLEQVSDASGAAHLSIAIDRAGRPHIAFLHSGGGKDALVHGVRDDSGWRLTKADRELNSGFNPRLVFDAEGRPWIGHWASKSRNNAGSTAIVDTPVRLARQDAEGKWSGETVGQAFQWSAFALAPNDRPWFAFAGCDDKLVVARGDASATAPAKAPVAAANKPKAKARR